MRCTKCGKYLPLLTKFCQKCGQPVDPERRRKAQRNWIIFCLVGWIIISFLFFLLGSKYKSGQPEDPYFNGAMFALLFLDIFFSVILIILLPVFLIRKLIAGFKFCFKHPKFLPIPLVIILIIAGSGYFFYGSVSDFFYGVFYGTSQDPVFLLDF